MQESDLEIILRKYGNGIDLNDKEFETLVKELKQTSKKLRALQKIYQYYTGSELKC